MFLILKQNKKKQGQLFFGTDGCTFHVFVAAQLFGENLGDDYI